MHVANSLTSGACIHRIATITCAGFSQATHLGAVGNGHKTMVQACQQVCSCVTCGAPIKFSCMATVRWHHQACTRSPACVPASPCVRHLSGAAAPWAHIRSVSSPTAPSAHTLEGRLPRGLGRSTSHVHAFCCSLCLLLCWEVTTCLHAEQED